MPSQSQSTFQLLLFASAASYCNDTESLTLNAPMTLEQIVVELETRYPGVGAKVLRSCQVVVNLEYVEVELADVVDGLRIGDEKEEQRSGDGDDGRRGGGGLTLKAGDEVAFVPPVSSG